MKRLLSIAFASIVFFAGLLLQSCSKVNQSVFKPLTTEEIAKIEKKYPGFATTYDVIRRVDSFQEQYKVKFLELTYRDVCEYEKYKKDNRDRFYQEHDSLYSSHIHKGDSVLAYWKDYVDKINSSVESYRSNGITYSVFDVPIEVELYNKDGKSGFENIWYEFIISEMDTSYISRGAYVGRKCREFDSLSYDFMNILY